MSNDLTLIFSIITNLFHNNIFLIYIFSILILIIGDSDIELKIESRNPPIEIINTSTINHNKDIHDFLIGITLILFFGALNIGFDYFELEKTIQFLFGVSFLAIIYLIGYKLLQNKLNKKFLTKNSEIESRLNNQINLLSLLLAPLKAGLYLFVGVISIFTKKD